MSFKSVRGASWWKSIWRNRAERRWQKEVIELKTDFDVHIQGIMRRIAHYHAQVISIQCCIQELERADMSNDFHLDTKRKELQIAQHALKGSFALKLTLMRAYYTKIGAADAKKTYAFLNTIFDSPECDFDNMDDLRAVIDDAARAGAQGPNAEFQEVSDEDEEYEVKTSLLRKPKRNQRIDISGIQKQLDALPVVPNDFDRFEKTTKRKTLLSNVQ